FGDRMVPIPRWFRIGVGVERGAREHFVAGPKSRAAHLMRIRFTRDGVGESRKSTGVKRSGTAGETGHSEVEAPPEEMHRTYLPEEAAAEMLEDTVCLYEHAPETMRHVADIVRVPTVFGKPDRIGHFVGQLVNGDADTDFVQELHERAIEVRDRVC